MLRELPLEILTQIAGYMALRDAGEFARTCRKCYFAVMSHMWHHLTLHNAAELNLIAKRLKSNPMWEQRAIRFMRDVSFGNHPHHDPKFSSTLAASMFGIVSSPDQQAAEQEEFNKSTHSPPPPRQRIAAFGKTLLKLFPRLSNLVFDYTEAARNFCYSKENINDNASRLAFSGSVSLVNYRSDHSQFMRYLLAPFRRAHHLQVKTKPVVSLCDGLDESILTTADLQELATLGLTHLERLQLSCLDSDPCLETIQCLLESTPHLNALILSWIFPPNRDSYIKLIQVIQSHAHLYPNQLRKIGNMYQAQFVSEQEH